MVAPAALTCPHCLPSFGTPTPPAGQNGGVDLHRPPISTNSRPPGVQSEPPPRTEVTPLSCPAPYQQAAQAPRRAGRRPAPAWRYAAADLPTEPRSVSAARRLVRLVLGLWALDDLCDAAELVTSEILTNGITASAAARCPCVRLRLTSQPCSL